MSGRVTVIGIGPGAANQITPEATAALADAQALYGYGPYLARVPTLPGQTQHPSDNREEAARAAARAAPRRRGRAGGAVSGGDAGVRHGGSGGAEVEAGPPAWRALEVTVVPGITAMLAVAARVGAPLGHDFCALSLSDNLKPWDVIERRLDAAANAGFVIALYNPVSRARPWQLDKAFERLRAHLPDETPVIFGHAVGRADERMSITTIARADSAAADMATLVIVGSAQTRVIERPGRSPLVYTPRIGQEASA